jgi:hypothetical protein
MAQPVWDLTALMQRARERADMVGSLFVSDTELTSYLEAAFQELYGIASAEYEDLLVKTVTVSVTAGQSVIFTSGATTGDIKKLRGVRLQNAEFLSPVSIREIQNLSRDNRTGRPVGYWLFGDWSGNFGSFSLQLLPAADTAYQVVLYYQPSITLSGTDPIPDVAASPLANWDEYLVITAAIKMKDKEESSVAVLMTEKQALLANLRSSWTPVDVSEAQRVTALMGGRTRNRRAYDYTGPDDDS